MQSLKFSQQQEIKALETGSQNIIDCEHNNKSYEVSKKFYDQTVATIVLNQAEVQILW